MDNIFDGINDQKFEENLDQLTELVFRRLIEKYGPIYPLNFGINKEEILVSELARLNTILAMLEDTEQFEKCAVVRNRIRNVEATLKNMNDDNN
jgi:protein-arginine kinase activator protein McsA